MSNILRYTKKGKHVLTWHHPCINHLRDCLGWDWGKPFGNEEELDEFKSFDKVVYHFADVEKLDDKYKLQYQQLMQNSLFGDHLVQDGKWCYYEITPRTNWSRNVMMASIIRYMEEEPKAVVKLLLDIDGNYDYATAKLLSLPFYTGTYTNTNHWVGQPWDHFIGKTRRGEKGMDVVSMLLEDRDDTLMPKQVLGESKHWSPAKADTKKHSARKHPWEAMAKKKRTIKETLQTTFCIG